MWGPMWNKKSMLGITVDGELACPVEPHPKWGAVGTCQCFYWGWGIDPDEHGFLNHPGDPLGLPFHYGKIVHFKGCWWSLLGEGALRCSLYLSPRVCPASPVYSTVHSWWSHLYLYITPPLLVMLSLFLGAIKRSLKWTRTPTLLQMFLKLSLRPFE